MQVQLIKPHTHALRHYEPKEFIEVTVTEMQWLAEQGVIDKPGRDTTHGVTHFTKRGKSRDAARESAEENDQ